jgi:hypothetical protein
MYTTKFLPKLYVMNHVVTTSTIDSPTQNEITQPYGNNLKQNNFYCNWQYYIKYALLAMGAQTFIHFMDMSTVH